MLISSFSQIHALKKYRSFLALALLAAFMTATAFAQVEKGTITGLVKDSSGAVIVKAQVTLRNTASGLTTTTSTDGQGLFVSPPLDPGNYDVEIEAPGFTGVLKHVRLEVAQRITADVSLSPAELRRPCRWMRRRSNSIPIPRRFPISAPNRPSTIFRWTGATSPNCGPGRGRRSRPIATRRQHSLRAAARTLFLRHQRAAHDR